MEKRQVTTDPRVFLGLALALLPGCEFFSSDTVNAAPDARTPDATAPGVTRPDATAPIDDSNDDGGLPPPWIEVWRDDFSGASGTAPNPANWTMEVNPRPPNMELEYYTDRRDNVFLDGKGHLVIQALKESYLGSTQPYTSGRLNTQRRFEFTYGRIEARIRLPPGQGLWPAFWMLGANIDQVNWPACGELDIMEEAGSHPTIVHGSAHDNYGSLTATYSVQNGSLVDRFHLFVLEWTPDALRWFVDDQLYEQHTRDEIIASGRPWTYNHSFFLLLNLAVGGNWDGAPGPATVFPAQMLVDRVTVGSLSGFEAGIVDDAADASSDVSGELPDPSFDAMSDSPDEPRSDF